jgi:hydrogenase maturation protein HypF
MPLRDDDPWSLDPRPLVDRIIRARMTAEQKSLLFHDALARATVEGARRMREQTGGTQLALSGGVFQNALLRALLIPALEESGFRVYLNRDVPPGDGGLAAGQAWFR